MELKSILGSTLDSFDDTMVSRAGKSLYRKLDSSQLAPIKNAGMKPSLDMNLTERTRAEKKEKENARA